MAMKRWTEEDIPDLAGRTAIVTGANSGIGLTTAVQLARRGATTILACRSPARGEAALRRLNSQVPSTDASLEILDLGDLTSVDSFADRFHQNHRVLHLLVNNAGVMATPFRKTASGFESQFGTNHIGHFALTAKLMPLILAAPSARVVNVSSLAHRTAQIDFNQLQFERENYNRWRAYRVSKLANLLFTYELQRRLEGANIDNVSSLAAHPGFTRTNLLQGLGLIGQILKPIGWMICQSADMGALPTLRAATDPNAKGGQYYGPDKPNERRGYPVIVSSTPASHDKEVARMLWERSEELTATEFTV